MKNKNFFLKLKDGDFGLSNTYWIFCILIPIIYTIVINLFLTTTNYYFFIGVYTIYILTALTGAYNAANKFTGRKTWAILAKVAVVLGFISVIVLWFG